MIRKECKNHGKTEFRYYGSGSNRRLRCLRCSVDAVTNRRRKVKVLLVEHFGGKCTRCGYDKCIGALCFHHKDPTKKEFGLSANGKTSSYAKALKEAKKCVLLCHNCHVEVHHELRET